MTTTSNEQALKDEIVHLEDSLASARAKLSNNGTSTPAVTTTVPLPPNKHQPLPSHALLLLADSALPLGSFAFSSGLESYLAHHPPSHNAHSNTLPHFLSLSLRSLASATLPFLNAAYTSPSRLQELDGELDACTLCPVGKRASVAQGRALLTLWERALRTSCPASDASEALAAFSKAAKAPFSASAQDVGTDEEILNAHFPLIWATVCSAMGITLHECAYAFLFNHAKAVTSAGVRASVVGPYAAQGLLGSGWLKGEIEGAMERNWDTPPEEAGQSVPMLDLWVGRHELLYSRIFNS